MDQVNVIRDGETRLVQVVQDGEVKLVQVVGESQPGLVRVISEGPPGPRGLSGVTKLEECSDVDMSEIRPGSLLVYDVARDMWVANASTTVDETLNGGNF